MKKLKLVLRNSFAERFSADVERIIAAFNRRDISLSDHQAAELWERFSAEKCAGWLGTDRKEEVMDEEIDLLLELLKGQYVLIGDDYED